ncbi:sigma-70 family RNA polymerase sigma factor [Nocardioides sp. YIM 152315]|uniref:sigma-70 family RNA polymerase sigma factor n=1 Tax=Nocardioides sp. YIM 152315 TaxID=3031760 RepID=UPI0023DBE8CF|nr:sigma-70 family RNA polymerase sigma factor [Nocardioides sp. YIM 152315]MDF1606241.1 sigma-70 family RNA polymerase sigma factor [Nocardioides sp. YIM 152315]
MAQLARPSPLLPSLPEAGTHSGDCGLTRAERGEQTAALLRAAHEASDPDEADALRARVVLINRGVAEAVARRYRQRGLPQDDLNQVAYEGLTKAVTRFDPTLRNDLLTFAVPTIRGELQRYFRDQGWTVRPPRRIQEVQSHAHAVVRELEQRLGREPSDEEVASELDITPEEYGEAMAALGCFQPASLDLPVGADTATLGDLLPDADGDHDASDARLMLEPVVRRLSERDRRILYLRFFEDLTQAEIGEDLGVTQMQVSRLLSRILGGMREELEEE